MGPVYHRLWPVIYRIRIFKRCSAGYISQSTSLGIFTKLYRPRVSVADYFYGNRYGINAYYSIVERSNGELGNAFGNLAQRTLGFIAKNLDGYLPAIHGHSEADTALLKAVDHAISVEIPQAFETLALQQGVEAWLQAVFACNAYIDSEAPWALRKTDPVRMETVLATLYICIAQLAAAITPVIPESSTKLLDTMGVPEDCRSYAGVRTHWYSPLAESDFRIAAPKPLFPRLELPAGEGEVA